MSSANYAFPSSADFPGVLIATSNVAVREQLSSALEERRWPMVEAFSGADALQKLENSECQLLLMDDHLPDLNADHLATFIKQQYPGVDVLLLDSRTGLPTTPTQAPISEVARDLLRALRTDSEQQPTAALAVSPADTLPGMVGDSAAMRKMYRATRLVAPRETPVLLVGESGTGKELVAQSIHQLSRRSDKPMMTINCAAIPESLLESELFGYVRGAFTGAQQSRIGRIHAAQGGTLFLDEIGDMPLSLQAKILRFLEQGEVQRLGSSDVFRVDVRVIAATNANLEKKVAEGQFRKDLLYRLAVFPVALPPLRERGGDVVQLARHFVRELAGSNTELSPAAMQALEAHDWPGNVRELRHVIERATILADGATRITPEEIVLKICGA
jgi:DNA-binding NtrC family response regulator